MEQGIPVTQARADFAELVNRVVYGNERIVVTRHGRPLVALVSAADLDRLNALDAALDADASGEGSGRVVQLPSRPVTSSPLTDAPPNRYDIAARHETPGRPTHRGNLR
jgi:prevent-host-death family protein